MTRLLLDVHGTVFGKAFGDVAGRFRRPGEDTRVGHNEHAFDGVPSETIEPELEALWASCPATDVHRDKRSVAFWAAKFCQGLFRIHPFVDGNGRTARLVVEVVAVHFGMGLFWPEFRSRGEETKDRAAYIQALQ